MTLDEVWNLKELLSCVNNAGIYLLRQLKAANDPLQQNGFSWPLISQQKPSFILTASLCNVFRFLLLTDGNRTQKPTQDLFRQQQLH